MSQYKIYTDNDLLEIQLLTYNKRGHLVEPTIGQLKKDFKLDWWIVLNLYGWVLKGKWDEQYFESDLNKLKSYIEKYNNGFYKKQNKNKFF